MRVLVHELKEVWPRSPDQALLDSIGFDSLADMRDALSQILKRKIQSDQNHALHRQIVDQLISATPFELPAELVAREEQTTVQKLVAQLKWRGMTGEELRAGEAQIRAHAHEATLRALKEFFLLTRIAEAEKIEVGEEDTELEIEAIAVQSGESVRRVRARFEKEGGAGSFSIHILERKVMDHILQHSTVEDVPVAMDHSADQVETVDWAIAATDAPPPSQAGADAGVSDVDLQSTAKQPLLWINDRDADEPPLQTGYRSVLKIQMCEPVTPPFPRTAGSDDALEAIPPEGLMTEWLVRSEEVLLSTADEDPEVRVDHAEIGPSNRTIWTARFRLLLPREGDSVVHHLGITPISGRSARLVCSIYLLPGKEWPHPRRELYQRFNLDLPLLVS